MVNGGLLQQYHAPPSLPACVSVCGISNSPHKHILSSLLRSSGTNAISAPRSDNMCRWFCEHAHEIVSKLLTIATDAEVRSKES